MTSAAAIITKVPVLGRTKTRLARVLGEDAALAFHAAFLQDQLEELGATAGTPWELYAIHDDGGSEDDRTRLVNLVGDRAKSLCPGGSTLAEDLHLAFQQLLARHERVVIISADVPHIQRRVVEDALAALDRADVVLGGGPDGGYYLIALREPHDLFSAIPMGTASVETATIAQAESLGLRVAAAPSMVDIDEAQDLLALSQLPVDVAPRTRELLRSAERSKISLSLPTELQVEVTSRCNLKCDACLRTHVDLAPDTDLSIEDFESITEQLPSLSRVVFQLNGESMMAPSLFEMIRSAKKRGATTILNTNGTLLDEARRKSVLDSGLDELRISLDGATASTVERMTGADILEVVLSGTQAMIKDRGDRPSPRMSFWMIANQETIHELADLVRLAAKVGVEEVYLQRLVLNGFGIAQLPSSLHGRVDERIETIIGEAEEEAKKLGVTLRASGRRRIKDSLTPTKHDNPLLACFRPWRSAVITASKLVLPCCISSFTLKYDDLKLGDLKESSFEKIWNGPRYQELREGILTNQPAFGCAGCGLRWSQ